MKKHLFIFLSCCLISACNLVDQQRLKAEIKEEIIKEIENNKEVVKGVGFNFYNEPISVGGDTYYKHHSTLDCPEIKNGVQRDCYKIDAYHNIFCSRCMDDELISKWNNWAFPDGYKKK
jgi:hypothetical protein